MFERLAMPLFCAALLCFTQAAQAATARIDSGGSGGRFGALYEADRLYSVANGSGAIGVEGSCGGDRSTTFVGGGLPPSPVLATVPVDGEPQTVIIGAVQKDGTPSSPIESQLTVPTIQSIRRPVYWYKSSGDN